MLTIGSTLSLTIDKPAAGGRMIARVDGQVVLVSGAIPGERVAARVERVGKGVAYAAAVAIEEQSPDRLVPPADPQCGGCLYNHIAYSRQVAIKGEVIVDAFKRIGRLPLSAPVTVASSAQDGYRMRARLHARAGRVGFFREGTHDVCDARVTNQLLPESCDAIDRVANVLRSAGTDGAHELEIAENLDGSDRVIALDTITPLAEPVLERLGGISGITGIVTRSATRGVAHVSDRLVLTAAQPFILRRHVHAFFQGNRHLLGQFAQHVVDRVPPADEVVDLYAGVGLFAVAVAAAHGVSVIGVEGDRQAAADLAVNAAQSNVSISTLHQSVEEFVSKTRPSAKLADATVIVDPPRTGMSREAIDGVIRLAPARMVYVSCDVATLARDARRLVDSGYVIDGVEGFDLFPNTPHVETVVGFTRS